MGNWKNDKAEGEMRMADKKMVNKLQEQAKIEADQKWEDLKSEITSNGADDLEPMDLTGKDFVEWTIDKMRELGYNLPTKD